MNSLPYSSLPLEISQEIRAGIRLAGDNFTEEQLDLWFSQEKEAFYETNADHSEKDPWYSYMRYVNEKLGFAVIEATKVGLNSMLVLGPGSGKEVERFARSHPECIFHFVEASENFQEQLRAKFPTSIVVPPHSTGHIALDDGTQDVVCAFSVLHHIPNVSAVIAEVSRVTRSGGFFIVREPCSSMGDWRYPRSATPNERGISRQLLLQLVGQEGFVIERSPVPILLEPINKFLKKTIGFDHVSFSILYFLDRLLSRLVSVNDHYWRDSWFKKIGPSSYFYLFRKK